MNTSAMTTNIDNNGATAPRRTSDSSRNPCTSPTPSTPQELDHNGPDTPLVQDSDSESDLPPPLTDSDTESDEETTADTTHGLCTTQYPQYISARTNQDIRVYQPDHAQCPRSPVNSPPYSAHIQTLNQPVTLTDAGANRTTHDRQPSLVPVKRTQAQHATKKLRRQSPTRRQTPAQGNATPTDSDDELICNLLRVPATQRYPTHSAHPIPETNAPRPRQLVPSPATPNVAGAATTSTAPAVPSPVPTNGAHAPTTLQLPTLDPPANCELHPGTYTRHLIPSPHVNHSDHPSVTPAKRDDADRQQPQGLNYQTQPDSTHVQHPHYTPTWLIPDLRVNRQDCNWCPSSTTGSQLHPPSTPESS